MGIARPSYAHSTSLQHTLADVLSLQCIHHAPCISLQAQTVLLRATDNRLLYSSLYNQTLEHSQSAQVLVHLIAYLAVISKLVRMALYGSDWHACSINTFCVPIQRHIGL
jgi:hypothetical protein